MKSKLGLILMSTLLISSNILTINKVAVANDDVIVSPTVLPNDKLFTKIDGFDFSKNSIARVYNDDWAKETLAYSYGYTIRDNEDAYFLQGGGGNYSIKLKAYTPTSKANLADADGIMLYVDTRDITLRENVTNVSVGIKIYLSNKTYPGWFDMGIYEDGQAGTDAVYKSFHILEGALGYYYDESNDSWVETKGNNKCLDLPLSYKGYLYIPYSSYGWLGKTESDYSIINHGLSNGYIYLGATDLLTRNLGDVDAQGKLMIDNLWFVKGGDSHTHNYLLEQEITASCKQEGYLLYKCDSCNKFKKENAHYLNHSHTEYVTEDNKIAVSYCDNCGEITQTDDLTIVNSAEKVVDDNAITYSFHYGLERNQILNIKLNKNSYLQKEPYMKEVFGKWDETYTFCAWSNELDIFNPQNPKAVLATEDQDFYAEYVISSYDNVKYNAMLSDVSWSGGIYNAPTGKCVFIGASNSSLYHNLEWHMSLGNPGIPTINNSVAGGSSYNFLHYSNPLITAFKPKLVVYGLSSNDWAYWSCSEKDIFNNVKAFVENVHNQLPDTVIAIVHGNVLPGRIELEDTIIRMNERVEEYCDGLDYLEFIDHYEYANNVMLNFPNGWDTWTHMTQDVYYQWYSLIKNDLLSIIEKHGIKFN